MKLIIKVIVLLTAIISSVSSSTKASANQKQLQALTNYQWFSGVRDCSKNTKPAIEIYQYDSDSFILRQNKCTHFEAPFIYLLFGEEKLLVLDTGATADEKTFPLARTVQAIIDQRKKATGKSSPKKIIVAHTHSHSDHIAGDKQFKRLENATVIPVKDVNKLAKAFALKDWPEKNAFVDLGKRVVTIIPSPGHQTEAIAIYDPANNWLLTGDNIYPGRLYIRNWQEFQISVNKLTKFAEKFPVDAVLGAHIEMSNIAKQDYPMGATFQPNEASLVLDKEDLQLLNKTLQQLGDKVTKVTLDKFVIYPLKESY